MAHLSHSKVFVVAALSVTAGYSHALVAFNNFGPGDTFVTGIANPIYTYQSVANQFTAGNGGQLDKVTIALSGFELSDPVKISLYTDSGGSLGSVMTSWMTNPAGSFGDSFAPRVLTNSDPSVYLLAGSNYWLVAEPGMETTYAEWNFALGNDFGNKAYTDGGDTWNYGVDDRNAFRVEVITSSVPGPAALLPFALGLLAGLRRRRR